MMARRTERACEAIQVNCPVGDGNNGDAMQQGEELLQKKRFAVTKKSLGGFDGWRGWLGEARPA